MLRGEPCLLSVTAIAVFARNCQTVLRPPRLSCVTLFCGAHERMTFQYPALAVPHHHQTVFRPADHASSRRRPGLGTRSASRKGPVSTTRARKFRGIRPRISAFEKTPIDAAAPSTGRNGTNVRVDGRAALVPWPGAADRRKEPKDADGAGLQNRQATTTFQPPCNWRCHQNGSEPRRIHPFDFAARSSAPCLHPFHSLACPGQRLTTRPFLPNST